MDKSSFIQELYSKGCIKTINGRLIVDIKLTIGYTNLLHYISDQFKEKAQTLNLNAIVGMPYFGIIHASYLSLKINKPMCIIKNEKVVQRELVDKENVINKVDDETGINLIIVLESIEKGFRLSNFIYNVKRRIKNCNIVGIFTVCDNSIANNKYLNLENYYIFSIINSHDIINNLIEFSNISNQEFLQIYNTMSFKKVERDVFKIEKRSIQKCTEYIKLKNSNLFVSLYYTNFFHIVNIVNKVSPFICGVVINSNIIDQFTDEKAELLKKLAVEKKIIVINNVNLVFTNKSIVCNTLKKLFMFSDLVSITINQNKQVDIFTEFNLDLLKVMSDEKRGLILNMTGNGYNNNFINQKILDLVSKYNEHISGILLDKRHYYMRDDNMLYMTDEIEMIENTVQNAILNNGCDLVIYNVTEFKTLTKEYLESISSSVKLFRDSSWVSFCSVNGM